MNKAKKKQQAIRQKLIAAVAMLMVSAIMVVSSSYAWFTLSTAPEVTGIQTSIGANGNLEMALNAGTIGTANGSETTTQQKNVTWGNLVDLNTGYGLDRVQLLPSRLDVTGGALQQNLLQVPAYGADGRVDEMKPVIQGIFNNEAVPNVEGNGVRLFGTSSGMSDEALALRSAKMNFSSYMNAAKGKASTTLTANGGILADMAIAHGLDANATFTREQVEALNNVVTALEAAVGDIETALKYAVKAAAATQENGHTFDISGDLATVITAFEAAGGDATYLDTYVTELNDLKADVTDAKGVMTTALAKTEDTFAWDEFEAAIDAMMNSAGITVNGFTISEIKADPNLLVNKYTEDHEIKMNVPTGAGVFADIADFTDDYFAPIKIPKIDYGPIHLADVPATMTADTKMEDADKNAIPAYSSTISAAMNNFTAAGNTGTASLSDLYAYAIDLAFRTNAADSNLLLQTTAADRIYEGNTNEDTMGGGSYMEFTLAAGFKLETAKKLMACIRVVFMTTTNGNASEAVTIHKVAVLDVDNLQVTGGTVKVPLKLAEYSIASGELDIETTGTGENAKPVFATNDDGDYDATIMGLSQNVKQNLTALVYLDGNIADNSMVANGDFSLTGKMNLQFASSAELKPMEYTDLHIPENQG